MALGRTTSNGATDAATLTAEQVARTLVQPLQAASKFLSSGPTIIDTVGPLRIPKQAEPVDVGWVAENGQIGEVNPEFEDFTLLPETMQSVKTIVRYSNEILRASIVAIDAALQARLVTDVASKLDAALFASTVTDGTRPTGLFSYAGAQTLNVGGALTVDNVMDAWGAALGADVNVSNLKLFVRSDTFTALRKLKTSTGSSQYLLQPDPTADGVFRVLGVPVVVTNKIPVTGVTGSKKTQAALVDMSQVYVARDLAPTVTLLRERFAEFDQVGIRVVARYDAGIANAEALVRLDSISAAG